MIGIYNPFPMIFACLLLLILFLLPIIIRPWRWFVIYSFFASILFLVLWHMPEYDDKAIRTIRFGYLFGVFFSIQTLRYSHFLGMCLSFLFRLKSQNKHSLRVQPRPIIVVLIFALVFLGAPLTFEYVKGKWYSSFIPENIEIKHAQYVSRGLGAKCEIATFSISQYSFDKLDEFNNNSETRKSRHYNSNNFIYNEWQKTPYKLTGNGLEKTDRWLNGIVCSKIDEAYKQEIIKGLESPDSFYAKTSYTSLIVIPRMNLLVFSFSN